MDHAWTFQADCAKKQLGMINSLAARMASLMGLTEGEEEEEGRSYDADSESGRWGREGRLIVGGVGGKEGEGEGERVGGREGERGKEGGREGRKDRGREGGREGGKEGERG